MGRSVGGEGEGLPPPTRRNKGGGGALTVGGIALALWLIAPSFGIGVSEARNPLHPDPALEKFYKGLRVPQAPWRGCCDVSDCGPTNASRDGEGRWRVSLYRNEKNWEVHAGEFSEIVPTTNVVLDGEAGWLPVPDEAILENVANEQGKAVVCYTYALGILCFLPPPEF